MPDNKHWYYQEENGRLPIIKGPLSQEEMGTLIQRGTIQNSTQVRFVTDARWHAASDFLLLKPFLRRTASDAPSPWRKPALAALVAAILVFTTVYFLPKRDAGTRHPVKTSPVPQMLTLAAGPSLSRPGIIECTNRARAENGGLPPLSRNSLLDAIASERADDMLRKQYFAHFSPSGEGAPDVAQKTGYHYQHLAENIAMGHFQNDEKAVIAWMQSPGHRKNILSDECSEIGVAVKKGRLKGEEVWVAIQIFGEQSPPVTPESPKQRSVTYASANSGSRPGRECQAPESSLLDAITKAKTELSDLNEQAVSLHKEIVAEKSNTSSGTDASQLNQKVVTYNELINDITMRKQAAQRLTSDYNQSVEQFNSCIRN
jgi:uncharacterized protein YkwD